MKKKIEYLDGLRGAAAFIVFITHFVQLFYPSMVYGERSPIHHNAENLISTTPLNILYNGSLAVCIFFVLSGYVLSISFLKRKDYEILYSSATRRYFRLAIPSGFAILIGYLIYKSKLFVYNDIVYITNGFLNTHFSENIGFFEALRQLIGSYFFTFNKDISLNPVVWTMHYELIGSFVIFFLLGILGKVERNIFKVIIYILSIVLSLAISPYYTAFVIGMLLCEIKYSKFSYLVKETDKNKFLSYFFLLLGIYLGSYPYVKIQGTIYEVFNIIPFNVSSLSHVSGAILIVLSLLRITEIQKIFSRKSFVFLGKISFSLYLLHYLMLFSFSSWIFKYLITIFDYHISSLITFCISTIALILASYLMYKYIDQLSIRVSNNLYNKLFSKFYIQKSREKITEH